MIFFCMLVLVECVWYKVLWEDIIDKKERDVKRMDDWVKFVNLFGYKELGWFDEMGVVYYVVLFGVWWDNLFNDSFFLYFGK